MAQRIEIAAVGDLLMWGEQIASARGSLGNYDFGLMFQPVAPYLKKADLTIGNLETTMSGRESNYQKRNPKTGYPMFNCPDELASALKKSGFDVLTTANNHCMDRGEAGLRRTLNILGAHQIDHTGTFRSFSESNKLLIKNVKGIRVGILAYTYGTNFIPVPKNQPWLVNLIRVNKIIRDMQILRNQKADFVIVCLHFGQEFHRFPNQQQKNLVKTLFYHGADLILGAHPHVLQPIVYQKTKDQRGLSKQRLAIYSLGNFISKKMWNSNHTVSSAILKISVEKDDLGHTRITNYNYIPTWTRRTIKNASAQFQVLPITKLLRTSSFLSHMEKQTLKQIWRNTTKHLERKLEIT